MKNFKYHRDTPLWATIVGWVIAVIIALGVIFGEIGRASCRERVLFLV